MATIRMREINEGEIPFAAGTAVQDDPSRPAFNGNGPNNYVCVKCGTVLAHAMHTLQMNQKLRIKCAVCDTINVAIQPDEPGAEEAEVSPEPVDASADAPPTSSASSGAGEGEAPEVVESPGAADGA